MVTSLPSGYPLSGNNRGWFRKNHTPWNKGRFCPEIPGNPHPVGQWKKGVKHAHQFRQGKHNARLLRESHTQTIQRKVSELTREHISYLVLDFYAGKDKVPDIIYVKNGRLVAYEAETTNYNKANVETYRIRYADLYSKRGIELDFEVVRKAKQVNNNPSLESDSLG